jgi:hypothetical protein
MFRRIKQFNQLPAAEKQILFLAWQRAWQVRISLWFYSYKQTRSRIEEKFASNEKNAENSVSSARIASLVMAASNWVMSSTCLSRALVGEWMLKEAGFNPSLHIGVKKGEEKDFEAHAWLEMDGDKLIGGTAAEGFKQIYRQ